MSAGGSRARERIAYIASSPYGRYLRMVHRGFFDEGLRPSALIIVLPTRRTINEVRAHRLSFVSRFLIPKLGLAAGGGSSKAHARTQDDGAVAPMPRRYVSWELNSTRTRKIIESLRVDYLVNAGVPSLFSRQLTGIDGLRIVNGHIGDLPRYRNRNAVWWALYNRDPLIATVHQIDSGVDSGPIWLKEPISVGDGMSLDETWDHAHDACARLVGTAVRLHIEGAITPHAQSQRDGFRCYGMHSFFMDQLRAQDRETMRTDDR